MRIGVDYGMVTALHRCMHIERKVYTPHFLIMPSDMRAIGIGNLNETLQGEAILAAELDSGGINNVNLSPRLHHKLCPIRVLGLRLSASGRSSSVPTPSQEVFFMYVI